MPARVYLAVDLGAESGRDKVADNFYVTMTTEAMMTMPPCKKSSSARMGVRFI